MRKLTLLVLMLVAVTASAQQIDLKSLDKLAAKAKNKTDINMDEAMVKSAAGFLDQKKGDEALAKKTVEGLKGLYVRVYEFDRKGAYTLDDLKPVLDQLKAPNWTAFLQSKEDGEQTEIWMHRTNGESDGILLVSAEGNEVVVINALGAARLQDLTILGELGNFAVNAAASKSSPPVKQEPAKK